MLLTDIQYVSSLLSYLSQSGGENGDMGRKYAGIYCQSQSVYSMFFRGFTLYISKCNLGSGQLIFSVFRVSLYTILYAD